MVRLRIVDVPEDAGIAHVQVARHSNVCVSDIASLGGRSERQEFRDELAGATDWMAMAALIPRDDQEASGRTRFKSTGDPGKGFGRNRGMIHRRKQNAVSIRWNGAQSALKRAELSLTGRRIHNEGGLGCARGSGANRFYLLPDDDDYRRAMWSQSADQTIQEGLAAHAQQCLR